MTKIYLHADDFGMNEQSSERILQCYTDGYLNGISVLTNARYKKALFELKNREFSVRAHLNLVEGPCVSDRKDVSLLVDERGYFRHSFIGLLFLVLSPKRKKAMKQIERELEKQLLAFCRAAGSKEIALDSHQHIHMIPPIFRALLRVTERNHLNVQSMRIPAEPLTPFLKKPSLYRTYRPGNIMKNLLLNMLFLLIKKETERKQINRAVFMGLIFSGSMEDWKILKVLPDFVKIADRKNMPLELLFHPGDILPQEQAFDCQKTGFLKFYYHENRKKEADVLKSEIFYKQIERYKKEL